MSLAEKRRFAPPGSLVNIGGCRIHLHAMGEAGPSVVLDSALAGTSLSWSAIQPEVAASALAVSYDRAGFGWSGPAHNPRRVDVMMEELRAALAAGGISAPYVLVGHSYGGWIVWLFAARHPDEVSGMVLVDVPHPREWADPTGEQKRRIARGARVARWSSRLAQFGITRVLFRLAGRGLLLRSRDRSRVTTLLAKVPDPLRGSLRAFWSRPWTLAALASLIENAPESARLVSLNKPSLGDKPLVVLTASHPSPARMRDQQEVATFSSRSRHVVARTTSHWIPLDEPEIVIDAVRGVLASVS